MELKQSKDQKTSQRSYANFINTNLMDRELIVKDPPPRYIKRWLNSYLLLITLQFQVWNFSLFWPKKAKIDNFLTFMLNNYLVMTLQCTETYFFTRFTKKKLLFNHLSMYLGSSPIFAKKEAWIIPILITCTYVCICKTTSSIVYFTAKLLRGVAIGKTGKLSSRP